MKLAILIPWHKSLGFDPSEDTVSLEKKMMVLDYFPNLEQPTSLNDFLILYQSLLNIEHDNNAHSNVFIAFVKNIYVINERMFGNISYKVMNTLHAFTSKIKSNHIHNNNKWSSKFRQIRGRFPTKNEVIVHSLVD